VVVGSYQQLAGVLGGTVGGTASGQLFGAAGSGLGADGGYLHSFTVGGITYTYQPTAAGGQVVASNGQAVAFDAATGTFNVHTASGGQFHVDVDDGGYSYRAPAGASAGFSEQFSFRVVDADGDLASAQGTVSVAATGQCLTGTQCDDTLRGGSGNDTLVGGGGHDILVGGAGNDTLRGGDCNDTLVGGSGNDRLEGGLGSDVFQWRLADVGTAGQPAVDTVSDFNASNNGGDVLDLRDLLGDQFAQGGLANLHNYLDVDTQSQPGSTIVRISTSGGFANGQYDAGAEDQRIVLEGVNLRDAMCLGSNASDDQVLNELLNRNKLEIGGP